MSYTTGQQAQAHNESFDEETLRASDSYFLSPSFGSIDNGLDYLHHQAHSIRVKEEPTVLPLAQNGAFYASPALFPDTGYTTPTNSSTSSDGASHQHITNHSGGGLQKAMGQELDKSEPVSELSETKDTEEEKDRKRALNRAAQKAFRDRKEAKVKQLEQKLRESEQDREQLLKELEDLRKHNIEMHAENRILLQTQGTNAAPFLIQSPMNPSQGLGQASANNKFTFPSQRDFVQQLITLEEQNANSASPETPPPIQYSFNGQDMMTVAATWEYLHRLSEKLDFDVSLVMCKLKGRQVCHGNGPSFLKSDIDRYIDEARLR